MGNNEHGNVRNRYFLNHNCRCKTLSHVTVGAWDGLYAYEVYIYNCIIKHACRAKYIGFAYGLKSNQERRSLYVGLQMGL